jgi:hypothetical protein
VCFAAERLFTPADHGRLPGRPATRRLLRLALPLFVSACAAMPRAPADSCMQQTMDSLEVGGLADMRQHCLAAGTIAIRCGGLSATMAGYGKELADVFGPGDAEWRDVAANRAGRRCAGRSKDEAVLSACCEREGY